MIVRTTAASCDHRLGLGCQAYQELDPGSTQHFRDLTDMGWTTEIVEEEILTFCPHHSTELQQRRRAQRRGDLLCTLCVELGLNHDGDHIVPKEA